MEPLHELSHELDFQIVVLIVQYTKFILAFKYLAEFF